MPIIRPEPGEDVGELARQLLGIAEAEGLEPPATETSGPTVGFVVSEELLESYRGKPSAKADLDEPEPSGDSDATAVKSRRGRKSKGDK